MNCYSILHYELIDSCEISCLFCTEKLQDCSVKNENYCCGNIDLIKDNAKNVCRSCGSVHGYDFAYENIDFYENMYKIRRKSIYHRKYHIENIVQYL